MAVRHLSGVVGQTAQGVASTDFQAGVQTVAALEAVDENSRADKQIRLLEDKGNSYRFDATSTATTDDDDVIRPDDIASDATAGRWIKVVGLGGDVVGPASSTDNSIARYSGTGGKTVQGSTVYVDDSGNLGVGTASPAKNLHVYGASGEVELRIQSDVSFSSIVHKDSGNELIIQNAATDGVTIFHDDTTERMRIDKDGNVGIGTNAPADKFHVVGDAALVGDVGVGIANPAKNLHVYGASGEVELRIQSDTSFCSIVQKDNNEMIIQNAAGGGVMIFHDDSAERMRIDTDGNVGIGDNAPGTQLQMAGTAPYVTLQNSTSENTAGGCESKIVFEDHGDNALGQIEVSHVGTSDDEKGQLVISTNNDSGLQTALTISEAQAATFAGTISNTGDVTATSGNFTATKHSASDGARAKVVIRKSKGTAGSPTVITDEDALGAVDFEGYDGNSWATGACIEAVVSGTPGDGDIPTKLTFSTAADGSESPTTRLTIGADGKATFTEDILLDDGGSICEAGGVAAITISATGEVTKIGLDTPSDEQVLTWDNGNSKVVWADAGGGGDTTALHVQTDSSSSVGSPASVDADAGVVMCVSASGARYIQLSAVATDRRLFIKDKSGNASANNITILTNASEEIDGSSANLVISTNYASVQLVSDGTKWYII